MSTSRLIDTARPAERAVLVGIDREQRDEWPLEASLAELARLAETDGAEVVGTLTQRLATPNPRTFIGKGKVEELTALVGASQADVVIFDDELSPSQQANLEHELPHDAKVIDRTALILDIFGQHARTRAGRMQVQLAQLTYLYPRLRGMWAHLAHEQTRGGIGSRFGQGESQLEVDRRLVQKRMSHLRGELAKLERQRQTQTKARRVSGIFRVALAGYTNAGKSTLLNALTSSDVYVQDQLFATLDPTTRGLELTDGRRITLTDTVGFIQKLPTMLVESFKSTLAEVAEADLCLVVVDASDPAQARQLTAVEEVLSQIGAEHTPRLTVYNKCDLLERAELEHLQLAHPDACFVSAASGAGLGSLLFAISNEAAASERLVTLRLPYTAGKLTQRLHTTCQIIREQYLGDGLLMTVRVPAELGEAVAPYVVEDEAASALGGAAREA